MTPNARVNESSGGVNVAWRCATGAATFESMGGRRRERERTRRRSRESAWLAGAIVSLLIAPACTSETRYPFAPAGTGGGANILASDGAGVGAGDAEVTGGGASSGATNESATTSLTEPPSCSGGAELSGTYTVPVSTELEPYATFSVTSIRFCERSGSVTLSYDLPALLVGDATGIDLRGPFTASASSIELEGDAGTANCTATGTTWSCREDLSNLSIQDDKLAQRFAALPSAEAAARSSVADAFSQDPIGVLTFTTP